MFNGFGLKLVKINVFVDLKSTKHPDINFFYIKLWDEHMLVIFILFFYLINFLGMFSE